MLLLAVSSLVVFSYLQALKQHDSGYNGCLRRTAERWPETARAEAGYEAFKHLADIYSEDTTKARAFAIAAEASRTEMMSKEKNAPPLTENQIKFCQKAWPAPKLFEI